MMFGSGKATATKRATVEILLSSDDSSCDDLVQKSKKSKVKRVRTHVWPDEIGELGLNDSHGDDVARNPTNSKGGRYDDTSSDQYLDVDSQTEEKGPKSPSSNSLYSQFSSENNELSDDDSDYRLYKKKKKKKLSRKKVQWAVKANDVEKGINDYNVFKERFEFDRKSDTDSNEATIMGNQKDGNEMPGDDVTGNDIEKQFLMLKKLLGKSELYAQILVEKLDKQRKKADERSSQVSQNSAKQFGVKMSPGRPRKSKSKFVCVEDINELLASDDDSSPENDAPKNQPVLFKGILRPYQIEGLDWLKVLYENKLNGILADEMGLGKTVQCVALISHLIAEKVASGPFLITGPLSTIPNWASEFKRFAPKIPLVILTGDKKRRQMLKKQISISKNINCNNKNRRCFPVVIMGYDTLRIESSSLCRINWEYIVIDEGHKIKNFETKLARKVRTIPSIGRLILTGTPLQNNLPELWALLNYLMPYIFDDLRVFQSWFEVDHLTDQDIIQQEHDRQIISKLQQILKPFMLRRTKVDADLNLPPKSEVLVYASMSQLQASLYKQIADKSLRLLQMKSRSSYFDVDVSEGKKKRSCARADYKKMFKAEDSEESDFDERVNSRNNDIVIRVPTQLRQTAAPEFVYLGSTKNNALMQLRKVCNHPYLFQWPIDMKTNDLKVGEELVSSSGKMRILDELLKGLKVRGHRVLLFSQFTTVLDIIEEMCDFRGHKYFRLDGRTDIDLRSERICEFNKNDDVFIFLISTRAGGLGINLASADTVIIYDSDWNPQMDLQAQDRCHRIGQSKPVIVYRLITSNSVEDKIFERANSKRKLEKMIIQSGKFRQTSDSVPKVLTTQELIDILQSTDFDSIVKFSKAQEDGSIFTKKELDSLLDRTSIMANSSTSQRGKNDNVFKVIQTN